MRTPHPVTPGPATTPISDSFCPKRGKPRGSYNCGRCGQPKKGHICHLPPPPPSTSSSVTIIPTVPDDESTSSATSSLPTTLSSVVRPRPPPPTPRHPSSHLRRALSFDDINIADSIDSDDESSVPEMDPDYGSGRFPTSCLWEVLRRLPPPCLLSAAKVCKGWRDTTKKLWKAAEELRLRVPAKAQVGFVGSVLQKCPGLVKLSLKMERLGFFQAPKSDLRFAQLNHLLTNQLNIKLN